MGGQGRWSADAAWASESCSPGCADLFSPHSTTEGGEETTRLSIHLHWDGLVGRQLGVTALRQSNPPWAPIWRLACHTTYQREPLSWRPALCQPQHTPRWASIEGSACHTTYQRKPLSEACHTAYRTISTQTELLPCRLDDIMLTYSKKYFQIRCEQHLKMHVSYLTVRVTLHFKSTFCNSTRINKTLT